MMGPNMGVDIWVISGKMLLDVCCSGGLSHWGLGTVPEITSQDFDRLLRVGANCIVKDRD